MYLVYHTKYQKWKKQLPKRKILLFLKLIPVDSTSSCIKLRRPIEILKLDKSGLINQEERNLLADDLLKTYIVA